MDWTIDEMMARGSCYKRNQFEALWDGRESLTTVEFLALDAPVEDRAFIVTLMEGSDVLRLWACDMVESFEGTWPAERDGTVEAIAEIVDQARQAVADGRDEAWYIGAWRKGRGIPGTARGVLHWRGAVAARLAFKAAHSTDPENGEALLAMLVARLEE